MATLEGGGKRLLVVVEEEESLRVDWDAFARYGTAPWSALLAGDAASADVQVFLMADNYYNMPFEDDAKWRSFQLRSPDVDEAMYAYAEVGTLREKYLSAIAAVAPQGGPRMVLRIARRGGGSVRHQFEIERLLAAGWVLGGSRSRYNDRAGGEKRRSSSCARWLRRSHARPTSVCRRGFRNWNREARRPCYLQSAAALLGFAHYETDWNF